MPRLLVSSRLQSVPYMPAVEGNKLLRSAVFSTVQRHPYISIPLWSVAGIDHEPTAYKSTIAETLLLDRPQTPSWETSPSRREPRALVVGQCSVPNGARFLNGATMDSKAPGESLGASGGFCRRNHARFVQTRVLAVTVSACVLRPGCTCSSSHGVVCDLVCDGGWAHAGTNLSKSE